MKTNYVFFADGFEEIEALTVVDVLRRAGMPVTTVSVTDNYQVEGAHGVTVLTDVLIDDVNDEGGWLILPGGMPGATNLRDCEPLQRLLADHAGRNLPTAAICASPSVVLASLRLLDGRRATCYPGMELDGCGAQWMADMVVCDGNIVTGRGPAAATEFALAIVAKEMGKAKADEVAGGMLV